MIDLIIIIGLLAVAGVGCLIWKLWVGPAVPLRAGAPARRRENARDWQRRFGSGSLLAANFLQPTQNEILETLYVLDHLTPGWEIGEAEVVERAFLQELALSFPTLRKESCLFPLPFAEIFPAAGKPNAPAPQDPAALRTTEAAVSVRREEFRLARAQFNALEQMVAGSTDPADMAPGSLASRPSEFTSMRRRGRQWLVPLAGAAVLFVAAVAVVHFGPQAIHLKSDNVLSANPAAVESPVPPADAAGLVSALPASADAGAASAVIVSTPPPVVSVDPGKPPTPPLPSTVPNEKLLLERQVAASKQRALSKYPALAVEGSEINLRFVFRYKNLVQQNSPRLLDPNWPEQLVEECAAAASPKQNTLTQVLGKSR